MKRSFSHVCIPKRMSLRARCFVLRVVLVFLATVSSCFGEIVGIIVYKDFASDSDQNANVSEVISYTNGHLYWIAEFPKSGSRHIDSRCVISVLRYSELISPPDLYTQDHLNKILSSLTIINRTINQQPKSKSFLTSFSTQLNSDISAFKSGKRKVSGQWLDQRQYDLLQKQPIIREGGNAFVGRFKNGDSSVAEFLKSYQYEEKLASSYPDILSDIKAAGKAFILAAAKKQPIQLLDSYKELRGSNILDEQVAVTTLSILLGAFKSDVEHSETVVSLLKDFKQTNNIAKSTIDSWEETKRLIAAKQAEMTNLAAAYQKTVDELSKQISFVSKKGSLWCDDFRCNDSTRDDN